jgi:hypothetical protein
MIHVPAAVVKSIRNAAVRTNKFKELMDLVQLEQYKQELEALKKTIDELRVSL